MNPAPGSAKSFPCVTRLVSLTGVSRWIHAEPSQSLAYNDHYYTGPIFQITSVSSICGHHSFFLFYFSLVLHSLWVLSFLTRDRCWAHSSESTEFKHWTTRKVLPFILVSFILHSTFMVCLKKIISSYLLCTVHGLEIRSWDSHHNYSSYQLNILHCFVPQFPNRRVRILIRTMSSGCHDP